jgi:cytochrome c2
MQRTHVLFLLCTMFVLAAATACSKSDVNRPVDKRTEQTVAPAQKLTGEQLFKTKCAQCHKVKDQGGVIGPDLTTIASRRDADNLQKFLKNPKTQTMPSFADLPSDDLKAIVEYLGNLK